jgi:hypothetical protein
MKYLLGLGLLFLVFAPLSTSADGRPENSLVTFKGGIGVIPVSNVVVSTATPPVTTATANIVRGISPAGQIWVITGLDADVSTDGHIRVRGRGLLLGGGNGIGTSAGLNVFATLFCGPAASASASNSTQTGVTLEANGDFTIDDVLSPQPPNPCETPVLLIRNAAGNQAWFAAGIPE